ncbi:MAG: hypothetical protein K6G13_03540 [Agathobacter sp.]|uniref:hypothetical protein n=1 Tax=Agathobacter sp. TaxID=2021311 RepID=UPI0025894C82|nr:hypothetical protein [Agathobacter sp.]MCR5677086.1 hypothetical protein [Agathobacter sp.]
MAFFLKKLFQRHKTKKETQDLSYELSQSKEKKHVSVELCEQMIDMSREIENIRDEYRIVSAYLNDMQIIEDLLPEQRSKLADTATQISNLNHVRDELLETRNRISDSQFAQFQENEQELVRAIKRLESNETYLAAIERDLHVLEGEKLSLNIDKKSAKKELKQLKRISVWLLVLFATLLGVYVTLTLAFRLDVALPMFIGMFLVALVGSVCMVRQQECQKDIQQCDINLNHTISLENRVKIKYVNIKNAVDYACEKYHVQNSRELLYYYEQYLEAVKERKKFREANDDLNYYNEKLIRQLQELQLYDSRVWINYPHAICDKKEMVELKHNLIVRRQKLRNRLEYNTDALHQMKEKALVYLDDEGENRTQIESIIRRLDSLNQGAI